MPSNRRRVVPCRHSMTSGADAAKGPTTTTNSPPQLACAPKDTTTIRGAASNKNDVETTVNRLLERCDSTTTKAGWCLRQGLTHVATVDRGHLLPALQRYGLPAYLECCTAAAAPDATTPYTRAPSNAFGSLCRIIAGQFVSGVSAAAAWKRLQTVTRHNLTPATVLALIGGEDAAAEDDDEDRWIESKFQKPAGLTKAKARSIVDLARRFEDQSLSEEFLTLSDPETVRHSLLQVRGIGPWSCDMFLQFYLEHSNVLPLGDLGVRKGIAKQFGMTTTATGSNNKKKQDEAVLRKRLQVYEPYLSIVTYYMWRVVDTPDEMNCATSSSSTKRQASTVEEASSSSLPATPPIANGKRRKVSRQVTPD